MGLRNLMARALEISPEIVLVQVLSNPLVAGKPAPRFKVGQIWCRFDPKRHELVDENTGIQVAAGFDMAGVSEIDWGTNPEELRSLHDNMRPVTRARPDEGATAESRGQETAKQTAGS